MVTKKIPALRESLANKSFDRLVVDRKDNENIIKTKKSRKKISRSALWTKKKDLANIKSNRLKPLTNLSNVIMV